MRLYMLILYVRNIELFISRFAFVAFLGRFKNTKGSVIVMQSKTAISDRPFMCWNAIPYGKIQEFADDHFQPGSCFNEEETVDALKPPQPPPRPTTRALLYRTGILFTPHICLSL